MHPVLIKNTLCTIKTMEKIHFVIESFTGIDDETLIIDNIIIIDNAQSG